MRNFRVTIADHELEDGDVLDVLADDHRKAARLAKAQYLPDDLDDDTFERRWDALECPHVEDRGLA